MEYFDLENLEKKAEKLIKEIDEIKLTKEFTNSPNRNLDELGVVYCLTGNDAALYSKLKQCYIKQQSSEQLEFKTVLAGYAAGKYSEALFLAKDLLVANQSIEIFQVIIKICVNHLLIPEWAVHYAKIGLESHPEHPWLCFSMGIAYSLLGDQEVYYKDKVTLWEKSRESLQLCKSNRRNYLYHLALIEAKLGNLDEALRNAAEGYRLCNDPYYSALLSLIMTAQEDFTGSLQVIKRGLQGCPSNILLRSAKVYTYLNLSKITQDKAPVKKSIISLLKSSLEFLDNASTIPADERIAGLTSIKEENSNPEHDSLQDVIKLAANNSHNPNFQQALRLAFEAAFAIQDEELIEFSLNSLQDKKAEQAIYEFHKTGDINGLDNFIENLKACELLAKGRYDSGDKARAMSAANQAISLDNNSAEAWIILGKIHKDYNQLSEAMNCFVAALKCANVRFSILPVYI
ncbi:unnamed protein product [Blepharisma stoltei]|uniref:Tetratricopeptide repeat protein n=1 Tax=Blepharisma stoltei TaxID=1481888 RepID=A0AAU9KQT9_9CILI|nr:unnamed protein product [Blepharisma stoltei]